MASAEISNVATIALSDGTVESLDNIVFCYPEIPENSVRFTFEKVDKMPNPTYFMLKNAAPVFLLQFPTFLLLSFSVVTIGFISRDSASDF